MVERFSKEEWYKILDGLPVLTDKTYSKWCLEIHPIKEVFAKAIDAEINKNDNFCYAYIVENTPMSADEIKNLMYISSGWFDFGCWCDEVVEWVVDKLIKCEFDEKYSIKPDIEAVVHGDVIVNDKFKKYCAKQLEENTIRAINNFENVTSIFKQRMGALNRQYKVIGHEYRKFCSDNSYKMNEEKIAHAKEVIESVCVIMHDTVDSLSEVDIIDYISRYQIKITDRIAYKSVMRYQKNCPDEIKNMIKEKGLIVNE